MKSYPGLIALCTVLPFALLGTSPSAPDAGTGSTSQNRSPSVTQQGRQQLIGRLDAMKESLDALEQAMRAGSVDAQQQQITELRRQLAAMRTELSSGGDRQPQGGRDPSR